MVAETVKSYPYSAFLPLSQPDINYSNSSSCSSALLPQALNHQYSSSPNRMDRGSIPGLNRVTGSPNGTPSGLGAGGLIVNAPLGKDSMFPQRKQREFIPDNKKDESYWDRRRRNNEAAKRSREKRRFNDMILEQRVLELSKENHILKAKLTAIENKYQVKSEGLVNEDQVIAAMPQSEQILALTRRSNLSLLGMPSPSSLLSPSSLPASPPGQSSAMSEDEQYALPQYDQPQESNVNIPSRQSIRSHSPDYYPREPPQPRISYSPEPPQNFYETASAALNLSARSSRSPINNMIMDCCEEQSRTSDYSVGSSLPHKLRHKNQQHSNNPAHGHPRSTSPVDDPRLPATAAHHYQQAPRSASPSSSPSSSTHHMYPPIKSEPITREAGDESPVSSDDRDSGVSLTSSPTLPGEPNYIIHPQDVADEMDCDSDQLRARVNQLATEVRTLKHFLTRNPEQPRNVHSIPRR